MGSDEGKIFIRRISRDTDKNLLRDHFSKFGEVLHVKVKRKKAKGRSRKLGFVAFSDPAVIDRVLQENHQIDNREVVVKRFTSREEQNPAGKSGNFDSGANVRTKRIFVVGLPFSLTLEEFRAYFETYGPMCDAVITIDLTTQPPRVYGSVSFYSEDSVNRVLQKSFHDLNGNPVKVLRSLPKDANPGVASGGGGDGPASGADESGATSGGGGAGSASGGDGAGATSGGDGAGSASGGDGAGATSGGDGAGAASGGGEAGAASGGGGAGAFPVIGGSGGSSCEGHMDSNRYMQRQNTGSGYFPYGAFGYGYGSNSIGYGGLGGYGTPHGNPGIRGAGPRSSWGTQVLSGYGNVEYGNASHGGGSDPGSAVMEQVGGSAVNDSSSGSPSAYGAVDGNVGGYTDASIGFGGYGNHQMNNGQAGSGESHGDGTQAQQ